MVTRLISGGIGAAVALVVILFGGVVGLSVAVALLAGTVSDVASAQVQRQAVKRITINIIAVIFIIISVIFCVFLQIQRSRSLRLPLSFQ